MTEEYKTAITDEQKQLIKSELGIDPDSELLSPMVDFIFKRIFTSDEKSSKGALIDFVNCILEFEGDCKIVDLTVVNPQIPVVNKTHKQSIFDIRAVCENGEQIVIEMQRGKMKDFKQRAQYLLSKAYAGQSISGEKYRMLKRCYLVCITDFDVIKGIKEPVVDYRYRDRQGNDLTSDETIVFLDLTKLVCVLNKNVSDMTGLEQWAVFIKHATDNIKLVNKIAEEREGIKMARSILREISSDDVARAQYESELIYQLDYNSRMGDAWEDGMEIGIEKGKIANAIENAIEMAEADFSFDMIKRITKLPDEEITRIMNR